MGTEDWEQSHLPLDDPRAVPPPRMTSCGYCGHVLPLKQSISGVARMGRIAKQDHFCCRDCRDSWKSRMRKEAW